MCALLCAAASRSARRWLVVVQGDASHAIIRRRPRSLSPQVLCDGVALNTTASLDDDGVVLGNKTEGALLAWARDLGYDYAAKRESGFDQARGDKLFTFSSDRKVGRGVLRTTTDAPRMTIGCCCMVSS